MSERYVTVDWSEFALKNNSRSSGNSYTELPLEDVVITVLDNWKHAKPGSGETGLDRKVLVPVPPRGFFCPPRARVVADLPLKAEVKFRQEGEDPYIETYAEEADARRLGVLEIIPAQRVEIVCYSAAALLENGGKRTTDAKWEIVCLLATTGEKEPMTPLTMARNFLEKTGGTKSVYTAQEFAESVYYWSSQRGVRVKLQ